MEEQLKFMLSNINDWLKFGEAKNATLLATDIAAAIGIFTLEIVDVRISSYLYWVATPLLILAAILCLMSFLPVIKLPNIHTRTPSQSDNLIFFGDAAKYDGGAYLEALYSKNGIEFQNHKSIEIDFAVQIVVNSRIALAKYNLFILALWLTVAAALTPVLGVGLFLILKLGKGIKK